MSPANALAVISNALLILIVVRAISARLFSRYTAFYCYIGFIIASSAVQLTIWAVIGKPSTPYYWSWHLPNLLSPILLTVALVDIWKRIEPPESFKRRLLLVLFLAVTSTVVVFGARLLETSGDAFFRYQAGALFAQMLVSIFVYMRVSGKRDINLGRNLKGILLGISLLVGLQGLNFAHLLFIGTAKEVFVFCLQFFYFLALAIFTYSLWNYEPITALAANFRDRLGKVNDDLEKAVRILASSR